MSSYLNPRVVRTMPLSIFLAMTATSETVDLIRSSTTGAVSSGAPGSRLSSTSLIESAKLCGVEPCACLREATLRAVRNPSTVTLARDLKSPEA
jgi:hypothetical protein